MIGMACTAHSHNSSPLCFCCWPSRLIICSQVREVVVNRSCPRRQSKQDFRSYLDRFLILLIEPIPHESLFALVHRKGAFYVGLRLGRVEPLEKRCEAAPLSSMNFAFIHTLATYFLASDEPVTAEHAHAGDKQVRGLHALAVSGERFFTMFLQARAEILLALVFLHAAAHVAGVMVVAASLELKVWKLYE